jgi:hypothetical protein
MINGEVQGYMAGLLKVETVEGNVLVSMYMPIRTYASHNAGALLHNDAQPFAWSQFGIVEVALQQIRSWI